MAHPQHNFTSNFNGSDGHNAELTLNINGVEKKYTPAGNDQTYNVPGVARIDINLDGADLVQAIQTALDGAAQPVLVEMSIYDEEVVYQYIGETDGQWYFGTCITTKIATVTVAKEDGAVNSEQIPVANGVVIVESDGLNVYSRLRTALALGQLPVLSYVGANPVYAQYEKTADNGDLIFVGALASASDTYVQYNIYTVASNNTVTVTTRAASAGGGGTPDDENGFFNSSLYPTPGDGVTTSLILNDFRIKQGTSIHGSNIEFVPTHQEGGIDFGEVWLNPGTYILNVRYTLQWVGDPRGTFKPLVCRVGTQPFDFSFEQENTLITSQIRVVTARQKVSIAFPFDADTPKMGIWVETLSIAQLASNTHPAVVHDTTLAGSGTAGSPLGVTTDAFGKVKNIPTSISQFRTGDVIPVDGPSGPAKLEAERLLELTSQNALAGNVAPAFVPSSTTTVAGQPYIYGGSLYIAKEAYQGPWDDSKFTRVDASLPIMLISKKEDSFYLFKVLSSNGVFLFGATKDGEPTWNAKNGYTSPTAIAKGISQKVSKEEGKSLFNKEIADSVSVSDGNLVFTEKDNAGLLCKYLTKEGLKGVYEDLRLFGNIELSNLTARALFNSVLPTLNAEKSCSSDIFAKVGVVGDSYTEGYISQGGTIVKAKDYSWPAFMTRMSGREWVNFGKTSSTCKSWVERINNLSALNEMEQEGNKCQAYVIGLQINDGNPQNTYYTPAGVLADIGTSNNTYCAYLYKLILAIENINADAKIFVFTCPSGDDSSVGYNAIVRGVVGYCKAAGKNVFLCDLYNRRYILGTYRQFNRDFLNSHYTAIGYRVMAEFVRNSISSVIDSNVPAFQNVHKIAYDVNN